MSKTAIIVGECMNALIALLKTKIAKFVAKLDTLQMFVDQEHTTKIGENNRWRKEEQEIWNNKGMNLITNWSCIELR